MFSHLTDKLIESTGPDIDWVKAFRLKLPEYRIEDANEAFAQALSGPRIFVHEDTNKLFQGIFGKKLEIDMTRLPFDHFTAESSFANDPDTKGLIFTVNTTRTSRGYFNVMIHAIVCNRQGGWFVEQRIIAFKEKVTVELDEWGYIIDPINLSSVISGDLPENDEADRDLFMQRMSTVLKELLATIVLFQTGNVRAEEVMPDKKLNVARVRRGKQPYHSYRVLDLFTQTAYAKSSAGGSHASPRFHLRRGHLRKLENERTTWVRSCGVGNPKLGTVSKDYTAGIKEVEVSNENQS